MKLKKQFLKTIFLLLLPAFAVAQTYQPIPDSNASWIIQQDDGYGGIYHHKFSLSPTKDDTIINSIVYTKIYLRWILPPSSYYGAFRSDTNGKSFYLPIYSDEENEEYLLRDFSKNTGDTIYDVAYEYDWDTWILDFYVDSTELVYSGSYTYKVMYLSPLVADTIPEVSPTEPLVWMEKIGSFGGGILNSHRGGLSAKRLFCMQYNDTIYYDSYLWWFRTEDIVYEAGECADPVGIRESIRNDMQIQVIPNPFTNQITLNNLPDNYPLKVSIFNQVGQLVFKKSFPDIQATQHIEVNSLLPIGLYILKIHSDNKLIFTQKIIKNEN